MTESEDCSICLDSINTTVNYTLNCNHVFHRDCITRWLHTNPNCPLCRSPVDADHRYVNDGVLSEERLQYILQLKRLCSLTATGLEFLFPNGLQGYTNKASEFLESDDGVKMLQEASGELDSTPVNLLWALGASGITRFVANGGLQRLFNVR